MIYLEGYTINGIEYDIFQYQNGSCAIRKNNLLEDVSANCDEDIFTSEVFNGSYTSCLNWIREKEKEIDNV